MFLLIQVVGWLLGALLQPDVTLLENKRLVFDGALEVSEHRWTLQELGSEKTPDWSSYRSLILEMKASSPQRFQIKLYTPQGASPLTIQPFQNAWVRGVLPLQMFTHSPSRGSTLSAVFNNQRAGHFMFHWGPYLPVNHVQSIGIAMEQPIGKPILEIRSLQLSQRSPGDAVLETEPLVDEMGQWIRDLWPSKASSLESLQSDWKQEEQNLRSEVSELCSYGGYPSTTLRATGFFRVEQVNGVWWFVDPEGHLFFSVGADCVSPMMMTLLQDRNAVFSKLPPPDLVPFSSERMRPGVSFFYWNIVRRFGETWRKEWADMTARRMRAWGLNTVGNWSAPEMWDARLVPYTVPLHGWQTEQTYFGLPDVFSDEFSRNCDAAAASQCAKRKDDPYLLGYFIGNEPPWPGREETVAQMILDGPDTPMQQELKRYLNSDDTTERRLSFIHRAYARYLEVVNGAIRKYDSNHLNLGIRFGGHDIPEAMVRASSVFDVFSLNIYDYLPSPHDIERAHRLSGRPILIGEFHFGVPGRGMSSGLKQVRDQNEKAAAYQYYVENAASQAALIGTHWFQWVDQPNTGRPDGENYSIGLVDVTDRPYPEMVAALKKTQQQLWSIHTGKRLPTSIPPKIH